MQISQNLKLKQSQSLVMTPQLQQAIKLLQLNNLELTNLVNKELEENPFLENESIELDENNSDTDEVTSDLKESYETGESNTDDSQCNDYENRWDTDSSYEFSNRNSVREEVDVGSVIEQTLTDSVTLKGILQSQADLEFDSEANKKIAHILIDYIDENGWITQNIKEISDFSGFSEIEINKVLEIIYQENQIKRNLIFMSIKDQNINMLII